MKPCGYSPDGAEDCIDVWVPLVLGPQQENILCLIFCFKRPFSVCVG